MPEGSQERYDLTRLSCVKGKGKQFVDLPTGTAVRPSIPILGDRT